MSNLTTNVKLQLYFTIVKFLKKRFLQDHKIVALIDLL